MKKLILLFVIFFSSLLSATENCEVKRFVNIFEDRHYRYDADDYANEILEEFSFYFSREKARDYLNILIELKRIYILEVDGRVVDGAKIYGQGTAHYPHNFARRINAIRRSGTKTSHQVIQEALGISQNQEMDYSGESCSPFGYKKPSHYNLDYYDNRRDHQGQYEGRYGLWYND